MSHHALPKKILSVLILLSLVFSFVGQATIVRADPTAPLPFLDDFQAGIPSGFVSFAGDGGTASLATGTDTLPTVPANNGTTVATLNFNIITWGGVTRDFVSPLDLSGYQALRFWYKGSNSGAVINVELKSNGVNPAGANLFLYPFTDNSLEWRYFSIPFTSFVQSTGWNPGSSFGPTIDLTDIWGYSIQLPASAVGSFSLDEVSVTGYGTMVDFQSGVPSGFGSFAGASSAVMTTNTDTLPTVPTQNGTTVATLTYTINDYGGLTYPFTTSEDWSQYQGLSFWFKGSNNGAAQRIELKTAGANAGAANLFAYDFTENFTGWRFFNIPWSAFVKRTDYNPGAGLGNTIDHSIIWGYSVLVPAGTGVLSIDNIAPYGGGGGTIVPKVKFSAATYNVNEDAGTATVTVNLSTATTVATSVDYTTSNGTATAGTDYTTASGTLNFAAGDTSETFNVSITDNALYGGSKTINLALSMPSAATLGTPDTAVLTIVDDDAAPDTLVVDDYTAGAAPVTSAFGTVINFSNWGSENGNVQLSTVDILDTDPLAPVGQVGPISLLKVDYNIGSWGGFTRAFADDNDWVSQDWSRYDGVSFWLYGNNTGTTIQTEIFDNQQLGNAGDSATRYYYRITDNYTGWQQFHIPFSAFQLRTDYQPGGAPTDGFNLTQVSGYSFGFGVAGARTAYIADYSLYGDLAAHPLTLRVESAAYAYGADEGDVIHAKVWLNGVSASPVTVHYTVTDVTAVAGINYDASNNVGDITFDPGQTSKVIDIQTINDGKIEGTLTMNLTLSSPVGAALGWKNWAKLGVVNTNAADPSIIDDFEKSLPLSNRLFSTPTDSITLTREQILSSSPNAIPGQFPSNYVLSGTYPSASSLTRLFDNSRSLTAYDALRFWYKGSNSGQTVKVKLLDGQPDPAPANWTLAWSDEFDGTAGTAPNTNNWARDIGGQGYGNNEYQYYTDGTANAELDGNSNLVITAKPSTDVNLQCAYGPNGNGTQTCAYTSARLLTKGKIDFTYGRIESRMRIPYGQGIWPAFWMLGSDIESNPWPASGEIDIMENIGKATEVNKLYGTIHGPGYSGGSGIGSGPYDAGVALNEAFHTYAIEWEPTVIRWYLDGNLYFTVTPAQIPAGKEWVFNKPFFILMNLAVGGNWPGYPDQTTTFPQTLTVDYVRVYQGPDVAQRFESSFVDDSTAWKQVTLPFSGFTSSATQPVGAASNASPLLTHVRGYGLEFPTAAGSFKLDDVKGHMNAVVTATPTPTVTVTPSFTPTGTVATPTATATPTSTFVITPSKSPTPTITKTVTKTPTRTATRTPTKTATPTAITLTLKSIAAEDGWILESTETSGLGGTMDSAGTVFRLGDEVADKQYRAILSFNTGILPDNAIIQSAVVKIKQNGAAVGTDPFAAGLGNVWVDMKAGLFGTGAIELADFNSLASVTAVNAFNSVPVSTYYQLVLGTTGKNTINELGRTQFRLRFAIDDNDDMAADYMKFLSGDFVGGEPTLVITYTLP